MDKIRALRAEEWTLRSLSISSRAGATMDKARGEMKAKAETTVVVAHLRAMGQSFGFAESVGLSQMTARP